MFLASKAEDTPCHLNKVVKIAYETMYRRNYVAAQRINNEKVFEKQKSLILLAEGLVLFTIRYDFDVQLPYKPLIESLRKLKIDKTNVRQTALNFVNDWLRTTLCLQYEPHYIAVGSLYLSAKHHNVKLPSGDNGCTWWQMLNIVPYKLDAVMKQMKEALSYKQKQATKLPPKQPKQTETPVAAAVKEETVLSPNSCVSTEDATLVPESITSGAKLSVENQRETGNSEGLNGTVKNSMEDVTSVPEPTTSNAKYCPKDHCEAGNSQGLDTYMEHVSSVPESTTCNAEIGTKDQCETGNSEGFNDTVKNCMDDVPSIPESMTSNGEISTKIQCETGNSEGLNIKCMGDASSIPEPLISTPEVNTKNRCGTMKSNRVDGTVKRGLENEVQNAMMSLLEMDRIISLINRRNRNRSVRGRAISLKSLNDDEWIETESWKEE